MIVYLDACALNRPFDDYTQPRVRREADAVLHVLQRILRGEDELVWSSALRLELQAHPEPEIRAELLAWGPSSQRSLTGNAPVRARVEALVEQGLKSLDAAHVAFAEAGRCDVLLTCDDRLLRQARRLSVAVRVLNPVEYVEELGDANDG